MKSKLKYVGVALLGALALASCKGTKEPAELPPEPEKTPVNYYVSPDGDVTAVVLT